MRIDPDNKDCDIFKTIDEIFRRIKKLANKLTNTILIDKISMGLLRLEFKSDSTIKLKAIKHIVKKKLHNYKLLCLNLLHIKNIGNVLYQF